MSKRKALVVDDRPTWRSIFAGILAEHGYTVYEAGSYEDAMRTARDHEFAIAVVDASLDTSNPANRDGLTLLANLVNEQPQLQAIVVSGTVQFQPGELHLSRPAVRGIIDKRLFERSNFRALLTEIDGEEPPRSNVDTQGVQPASSEVAFSSSETVTEPRGTALVVDDDATWQRILADALEDVGIRPTCVRSLAEALGELRRKRYGLVTVDLKLPRSQAIDNFDGRHLLQKTKELRIPAVVVSAYVEPAGIEQDYQQYSVMGIMDKLVFDRKYFKELARELVSTQPLPTEPVLGDDLMFKVINTLLRMRFSPLRDVARTNSIKEMSRALHQQPSEFLDQLRVALETSLAELTGEAEMEEMRLVSIDPRVSSAVGDFTRELILSARGVSKMAAAKEWWPLRSERMKRVLVLHSLYDSGFHLKPVLLRKLAIQEGALNNLRKQGIVELASRLRTTWPGT